MRRAYRAKVVACALVCAAAAIIPGCYQGTEPLTAAASGSVDARLDGDWRCIRDDNDGLVTLSIRAHDTRRHDVRLRVPDEDDDRYIAHVSRVGETTIANVQELRDGQPAGKWVYVRYRLLREGVLDLSLVSEDKLKSAQDPRGALDEIRARAADEQLYENLLVCLRATPAR